MNPEMLQHTWLWLLSLSKIQLILLGGALALLVAVSKVFRFLFLLGFVVIFLTVLLPEIVKRYEQSPLPAIVDTLVRKGAEATKDPIPLPPEQKK
jgi:hypothetical protein